MIEYAMFRAMDQSAALDRRAILGYMHRVETRELFRYKKSVLLHVHANP